MVPVIFEDLNLPARLRAVSNRDLLSRTSQLARDERATTIQILHHLNEIARRKLYLAPGYSSLHDYCVRGLQYSSAAACRRIQAARCIREFPQVLAMLEAGELDLGTVCLIESILTEENAGSVLERVRGKRYRAVQRVVSEYGAPVVVEERILPVRTLVSASNIDGVLLDREIGRHTPHAPVPGAGSWVASEQKMFVQFLASNELMEKYEAVKALLSHSHPHVTFAEVLEVLLGEFIERHGPEARQKRREEKRSAAAGGKSSTAGADGVPRFRAVGPARERSRRIPAAVRDDVFVRDGNQCTYVAPNGTRRASTHALEVDHIHPWSAGGTHAPSNLRLLCAAHNRLAAEHTLGAHVMEHYWRHE